ncbi:MAG: hypothetical protein NW703_17195 [Nitrospiraceae bacterium]
MSNKAVAHLVYLHKYTVRNIDTLYMQTKTSQAAPQAIGIDDLSHKKGHAYRLVAGDLERGHPI